MSKVGAADRSRLLRLKKAELSGIVKSRKRKLREIFAVCESESLIPQLDVSNPDAPPINPAEAHFLEVTDILQHRLFNESNLPTRRSSLDSSKKHSWSKTFPDNRAADSSWKLARSQHERSKDKDQTASPGAQGNENRPVKIVKNGNKENAPKPQVSLTLKSSSKGSQTDLPLIIAAGTNESPIESSKESLESVKVRRKSSTDTINTRPNIDGTQKEKKFQDVTAVSSDKIGLALAHTAQSTKRQFHRQDFHDKSNSKIRTSSPAKNGQQISLLETDREEKIGERDQKNPSTAVSISKKQAENISSPASTFGTLSATATARHELSADTSPETEIPCHVIIPSINNNGSSSPSELKKLRGVKTAAKEQYDSLKAHKKYLREIMTKPISSPASHKSLDKQANTVIEKNQKSCVAKEGHDLVSNAIEENGSALSDLMIKDKANTTPAKVGITSKIANNDIQEIIVSKSRGQCPSVDALKIDARENCEENKVPNKSSSISSEKALSTDDLNITTLDSMAQCIMPKIPSKLTTAPPILEQRRNTRIGSGVLERKTVSEIIGNAQMLAVTSSKPHTKQNPEFARTSFSTSRSTNLLNTNSDRFYELKQEKKMRSKLSNVIFSHKPMKTTSNMSNNTKTDKKSDLLKEDYFMPLFLANASTGKGCIPALDTLLATANKTITTSDAYVPIHENQTAKILKRIYSLQSSHKWSLRQPKRSIEPIRPTYHWDLLLQESTWMRTDFKEERKWKKTAARNMALACAKWVSLGQEERKFLQVKTKSPSFGQHKDAQNIGKIKQSAIEQIPKSHKIGKFESLVKDDLDEATCVNLVETIVPTDIFDLRDEDIVFELRNSPITDKLLNELPLYGIPLQVPRPVSWSSGIDPDRFWKRPALPLSKYVEGKIRLKLDAPPRKSSRFEYEVDDEEENETTFGEDRSKQPLLPPESTEVALFDSKYKHILERIRNVNCFRPPSEFQMPLQSFFEYRTASQWTWDEDKELKMLVRDYTYNWSLISSILSSKSKSTLTTGAERRTPWECFERWIELEGLPGDMQKTHYFRLYTARIENANKNLTNVPPAQNAQGQIQQSRKRSSASVRVERRRNQKHLVLIDTMRKLAKKRETALQKQHHAAGLAAMRKAQEVTHVGNKSMPPSTPQDFSRLKYDREEVVKERLLHLQQRQETQRRIAMAQRNSGLNQQQSGHLSLTRTPAGVPIAINGSNSTNSGNKNHIMPGQNRPHPTHSSILNHSISDGLHMSGMGMNTVPQAPMQGQNSVSSPALDAGLVSRAHAISQHQQAILRQQQQQQKQQQVPIVTQSCQARNSPILRMNNLSAPGFPMQGNMMSPFPPNLNGVSTPQNKSLGSPGQVGSPQVAQPPQPLSHVQRIEIQYKAKYPAATPEQITSMISQAVTQSMQHHQRQNIAQSAINAAAGGPLVGINGVGASQGTPQLYAQMLRQQQENQQKQPATIGSNFQSNKQGGNGNGSSGTGQTNRANSGNLSNPN
ncbi:Chromatin modification-related protein [Podosphaera aphanis]|nr:Chromatin modification-related protein [Podosphaera aphanis]